MATTATVDVDLGENQIQIHELTIRDDVLVEFLDEFDDGRREDAVIRALKVGAATLQLAETSKDLEYVKREFESMQESFEGEIDDVQTELQEKFGDDGRVSHILESHFGDDGTLRSHIEDAFGEDGIFSERLDEELGEDGERIQRALDPDREGTPTYRLKQALRDEINELRDKLTEEEAEAEVRQRTTLKGEDFEENVRELLDDLVYQTPHSYEYTGETEGELTGRDVGDFVITLGDTDQRIVVEAKSEQDYTVPTIKEEMEAAIENRAADYGIFVSECASYLPKKVGFLDEFDREFLAVSVSQNEDDEVDPRLFRIGYNWAKMRAAQAAVDAGNEVDPVVVHSKVEEITATIERFQNVKKKCTNIKSSANGIESDLDEIADDVNQHLNDVRAELSKADV